MKSKKIKTALPLKSGTRQGCLLLCDTIPSLARAVRQEKEVEVIQVEREKAKLSVYKWYNLIYRKS